MAAPKSVCGTTREKELRLSGSWLKPVAPEPLAGFCGLKAVWPAARPKPRCSTAGTAKLFSSDAFRICRSPERK